MLFLLCQATGLKYNEAPECTGDVTGATPAACDELGADGCDGKCTSLRWRVVSTPVSNCLAVGPLCKRPDAASMTCSSLLDCEGKGWKKTWTSGTATTYSEDLGWAMSKTMGRCPVPGFSRGRTAGSRPIPVQHEGEIVEAIRATDGKAYEGADKSNYGGGCECGKGSGAGRICLRSKTPPSGGWKPAREVPCQKPLVKKLSTNRLPGLGSFSFSEGASCAPGD